MRNIIPFFILSLFLGGCADQHISQSSPATPEERLAYQIGLQIERPEFDNAFIGMMVQSGETGEILFQHNAYKMMMPASNEKILTSAATLISFGPEFQLQTKVYAKGEIEAGTLNGDLVIVGGGDPTLGTRLCKMQSLDDCNFFEPWIDALQQAGILAITGNLIGVDDIFDDEPIGYGWSLDDLSYYYATQISGLSLNENEARLTVAVDSATGAIDVSINPDYGMFIITNKATSTHDKMQETDMNVLRVEGSNEVIISGTLLAGKHYRQDISVHNPTEYFLHGLRYELAKSGIRVHGDQIDGDDMFTTVTLDSLQLIYTHQSPPMSEMIRILMKESQNLYAETFVKLLGAYFGKVGTFQEGREVVHATLKRLGLEPTSYAYQDGSGLARYNYISPNHLTTVLRRMYYHKYAETFMSALPVAGIDGTIKNRLHGTIAQEQVRAKTGTISNVRCLSGYATTADNEDVVFSIMANNFLCSSQVVMDFQDQVCMLLTAFSRNK
ncbi:D-alanyl-D-alanine carboxypeptidase/D-alanyl-D-alanine-endopeptidase [candidate division KSB1 bacterium]|nr:D-alanyl-D-alanine carboxypeptidase/D-alanyl-D-alanine-endopeptidase [candidate division KSB1 bacterium]